MKWEFCRRAADTAISWHCLGLSTLDWGSVSLAMGLLHYYAFSFSHFPSKKYSSPQWILCYVAQLRKNCQVSPRDTAAQGNAVKGTELKTAQSSFFFHKFSKSRIAIKPQQYWDRANLKFTPPSGHQRKSSRTCFNHWLFLGPDKVSEMPPGLSSISKEWPGEKSHGLPTPKLEGSQGIHDRSSE